MNNLLIAIAISSFLCTAKYTPVDTSIGIPLMVCNPAPIGCWSDYVTDTPEFDLREADVFAAYALDAVKPECSSMAAKKFSERLKIVVSLGLIKDPRSGWYVFPLQSWLAGTVVTQIFYAAWEFKRAGIEVDDGMLRQAEIIYEGIPIPQDSGCGLRSLQWGVNSCMDDFALTASGFAWIAAYENIMGRDAKSEASRARDSVGQALSPMSEHGGGPCLFYLETLGDGTHRVHCDGDLATAKIMGADHNRENPGYGLGLMTGIASACAALYYADEPCMFTPDEVFISRGLFTHAQEKVSRGGRGFSKTCVDFPNPDGELKDCSDGDTLVWSQGGYRPTDFPVKLFYDKRGIGVDSNGYQFDHYCESRISTRPGDFWSMNRIVFYRQLAHDIFK
jgi:hypothetical protein